MNILIPIAGKGERFKKAGFTELKPFIKINGKPIIEYAIESIKISGVYRVIANKLNDEQRNIIFNIFRKNSLTGVLHEVGETVGAAETCYKLAPFIQNEELIVINGDQYLKWDPKDFLSFSKKYDAVVSTYDHEPIILNRASKYSFIKVDKNNYATDFAEKYAISNHSLNGIHYWKNANDFLFSAEKLLTESSATEKYISQTFNYLIDIGKKITFYKMNKGTFFSLGTPEEIQINEVYL